MQYDDDCENIKATVRELAPDFSDIDCRRDFETKGYIVTLRWKFRSHVMRFSEEQVDDRLLPPAAEAAIARIKRGE